MTPSVQIAAPPLIGSSRLNAVLLCCLASFVAIVATVNLGMVIVCISPRPLLFNHTPPEPYEASLNCTPEDAPLAEINGGGCYDRDEKESGIDWDKKTQGMLLSAPYYGVVAMQLITGWLCDKFGRNKLIMMTGIGLLGVSSVASPAVIQLGVAYFFTLRVIKGIAMALSLSSILPLLTHWTAAKEQGLLVSLAFAGVSIGNALTYPISAFLCEWGGWQSIFYFAGGCGLSWLGAAFFLLHDKPSTHPRIAVAEKQYLTSLITHSPAKKEKVVIPWLKIITSLPVWAVIWTNVLFFGAIKGLIINLPIFVKDLLEFTITENGIFSSLPAACALVCRLSAGPIFDWARAKNFISITVLRKIFNSVGTVIPAALMFAVSQLDPNQKYEIISLITVGFAITEVAAVGGFMFTLIDVAPRYIGVLQGINNTIGLAPGFIMPVVIALMTPNGSREEWSHVFLMFGGLFSAAALIFALTASSTRQKWADPEPKKETADNGIFC